MMFFTAILLAAAPVIELYPAPQKMDIERRGVFTVTRVTPVVLADATSDAEVSALDVLFEALGFELSVYGAREKQNAPGIYIGEPGRHAGLTSRQGAFMAKTTLPTPPPGGYRLTVKKDRITVLGGDPAGTFQGCLLYTSPSPRDRTRSRMPSSA